MKLFLLTLCQTFLFCQSQPPFSPFEFLENLFKPSHLLTSPRQAKRLRSSALRTVKPFRPHLPISPSFSASQVCILFSIKCDLCKFAPPRSYQQSSVSWANTQQVHQQIQEKGTIRITLWLYYLLLLHPQDQQQPLFTSSLLQHHSRQRKPP